MSVKASQIAQAIVDKIKVSGETWKKVEWDIVPLDSDEDILELLAFYANLTPACIVTFEGTYYNKGEQRGEVVETYEIDDPTFITFIIVQSLRKDRENMAELVDRYVENVKHTINGQNFDLEILPMHLVSESRFASWGDNGRVGREMVNGI